MPQSSPLAQQVQRTRSAAHPQVRRKDKGMVGNGGQFAAMRRGESDVTVAGVRTNQPTASREVTQEVSRRLREEGVSGDQEFTRQVSVAWKTRFHPDGLTPHSASDRAILAGDLPPWRALASRSEIDQANEASRGYVEARRARDQDISSAQEVFQATDQMLVELGAEDTRRKREVFGLVLSQAAIMAFPRKYRGYAQGAFSAYMVAKALMGPQRKHSDVDIEGATQRILEQQKAVRQNIHPAIEQMNRQRQVAERAQWSAGLGARAQTMQYQGQEVRFVDEVAGKPRVEPDDVDTELDVEIS